MASDDPPESPDDPTDLIEIDEGEVSLGEGVTEEGATDAGPPPPADVASEPMDTTPVPIDDEGDPGEDALELSPDEGPLGLLESALADAVRPDPKADLALFLAEAEALGDGEKARAARLNHEAGHLQEGALSDESGAVKSYAKTLTIDPTFRANFWPLRRIFRNRELWDNLLKLYDAEIRLAPLVSAGDRADLLVERGRLLEEKLGRDADAAQSYRDALDAVPEHAEALQALLLNAKRSGDDTALGRALAGLSRSVPVPGLRAALAVERSRGLRTEAEPVPEVGISTLREALAGGAAPDPILDEIERMGRLGNRPDLMLEALGEKLGRLGDGEPGVRAALLRERARLLRAQPRSEDHEAALAALEEARRLDPGHPLLVAEIADLAEELGRPEALTAVAGDAGTDPAALQELALRRAEALARAGRATEALEATAGLGADDPVVWATRARLFGQAQDAAGLAAAYVRESEIVARGGGGAWGDIPAEIRGPWAASAQCRAAALFEHVLADKARAEDAYRRALALAPANRVAVDGLASLLASAERWRDLADVLATDAETGEGERRRVALETLVALLRDRLDEPERAMEMQKKLSDAAPEDLRARWRLADLEGQNGRHAAQAESLAEIATRVTEPGVAASLKIAAARAFGRAGDAGGRGVDLLTEALKLAPDSLAGAALDRLRAAEGADGAEEAILGRLDALTAELGHADSGGRREVARALRYRIAFAEAGGGRWAQAITTLRPEREAGDALALAWSWELARRANDAALSASLLRQVQPPRPDQSLALGEALELAGDAAGAEQALGAALGSPEGTPAAIGLLRLGATAGDASATVAALRALADAVGRDAPAIGDTLRREADLYAAAADLPATGEPRPDGPESAVLAWLAAGQAKDSRRVAAGLGALAEVAGPEEAPGLFLRAGHRMRAFGDGTAAIGLYRRAAQAGAAGAVAAIALSDLSTVVAGTEAVEAGAQRAETAPKALAGALLVEAAEALENGGLLRASADAYRQALAADRSSLAALFGLRRLARAAGDRATESSTLCAMAARVRTPVRAAQLYAEAALMLEDLGRPLEAAPLYWQVMAQSPDDQEAYSRLHKILSDLDDAAGLLRLLTHKLRRLPDSAVRVAFYAQRAELRLGRLGDRTGAARDLQCVLRLDPDHLDSLHGLAQLAIEARRPAEAARLLDRYVTAVDDDDLRTPASLELAAAWEAAGDHRRAAATLRTAAETHPEDPKPLERMADLYARQRDFTRALEALRMLEACLKEPAAKAVVARRIGRMMRDHQRDASAGAAVALERALELDSSGEGVDELVALYDRIGDDRARAQVLERAIADARHKSSAEPFDRARIERLRGFLQLAGRPDAAAIVGQCLGLLGGDAPAARPRDVPRPVSPESFRSRLMHPAVRGLPTEIWPLIAQGVADIDAVDPGAAGATRQTRIQPGVEPRLGWVESAARCLGLPKLALHVGGPIDDAVVPLDLAEPTLVVGRAVLAGDGASRFRVGRAIGLLRERATRIESRPADEMAALLAASAVVAGVSAPAGAPAAAVDAQARLLGRAIGRKEKKALTLIAPRFASEPIDAAAWRAGVLATADRIGLLVACDVGVAVRTAANLGPKPSASELRDVPAVAELVRFALSEDYGLLRRELGLATEAG